LLIVGAILSLASLLFSIVELLYPTLATAEPETGEPVVLLFALLQLGLGLIQIVVYVATIVFFLMWFYRSHENLPSFGVARNTLKYSSGWAVGSFFVPFVSLVVPYRAMKGLWSKSIPNATEMFRDLSPPGFFPLWWAAWLVSNFANQIHLRLTLQGKLSSDVSATFGIVTAVLDILAAILALMVVQEIDKQQTESSKLISPQALITQPPLPPSSFEGVTP
jgi:hypothetical protein